MATTFFLLRGLCEPVIIVHCTHGANRTGYFVAMALVELYGMTIQDALAAFASIRPPGVWRLEYVQALLGKFGGSMLTIPPPPEWDPAMLAKLDAVAGRVL